MKIKFSSDTFPNHLIEKSEDEINEWRNKLSFLDLNDTSQAFREINVSDGSFYDVYISLSEAFRYFEINTNKHEFQAIKEAFEKKYKDLSKKYIYLYQFAFLSMKVGRMLALKEIKHEIDSFEGFDIFSDYGDDYL